MLTREDLSSERIDQIVADARKAGYDFFLSSEEREASLQQALLRCQPGEDVWVFAYGSLMWNPAFEFAESLPSSVPAARLGVGALPPARNYCLRRRSSGSREERSPWK